MELFTERLLLRRWRSADREPFARLNADPRVMEFFPALMSREESDGQIERFERNFQEHGFGMWAVERRDTPGCIGCLGLLMVDFPTPFTPCVEIGWKLAAEHWGQGLATEGALESLRYGFTTFALDEIFSFTPVAHTRSRHVMERIGLHHDPANDFDYSRLPEGHPLRRHVLYRAKRSEWMHHSAG